MAPEPSAPERVETSDQASPRGPSGTGAMADNPMSVLVSGVLLLGAISAFIGWGLSHAYPGG